MHINRLPETHSIGAAGTAPSLAELLRAALDVRELFFYEFEPVQDGLRSGRLLFPSKTANRRFSPVPFPQPLSIDEMAQALFNDRQMRYFPADYGTNGRMLKGWHMSTVMSRDEFSVILMWTIWVCI